MAYPNYLNPYTNVQPTYPQTYAPVQSAYRPANQNVFDWVQGEAAANAYPLAPGTTGAFFDMNQPIVYMKAVDQMGKPSPIEIQYLVSKEDYEKIQNGSNNLTSDYVTHDELETAINNLKQYRKENKNNGKSTV